MYVVSRLRDSYIFVKSELLSRARWCSGTNRGWHYQKLSEPADAERKSAMAITPPLSRGGAFSLENEILRPRSG